MIVKIKVRSRNAAVVENGIITAYNTGDTIEFDFDEEWQPESVTATRTARFSYKGIELDIPFNGNVCPLPGFSKPGNVYVGVYWGDVKSTTRARLIYAPSILSASGMPEDPTADTYARIISLLDGKLNEEQLQDAVNIALAEAKESGEFDGADGIGISTFEIDQNYLPGGESTINIQTTDGMGYVLVVKNGYNGNPGEDGGYYVVTVKHVDNSAVFSFTRSKDDMPYISDITIPLPSGDKGDPGVSPTVETTDIDGGTRVTITDANGTHTFDVLNGTNTVTDTVPWQNITGKPFTTDENGNETLNVEALPEGVVLSVNGVTPDANGNVEIEVGSGSGGSGSSSVIEVPTTVSWSTNPTPTVTFDVSAGNVTYRFYKIADVTPTKEQILSAQWSISDYAGSVMYDHTVDATEIAVDTAELLQLQFSTDPEFAYGILYAAGDLAIDAGGTILNVNVPETGFYQIWTAGQTFPTTMTGSIAYKTSMELPFVQPDWNQNDITAEGYIRNRPFYEESAVLNFLPSAELTFVNSEDLGGTVYDTAPSAEQLSMWSSDWDSAVVIWDGVEYICQPKTLKDAKYIGNSIAFGLTDTGEPFTLLCADASITGVDVFSMLDISASADTTHTVQILINGAEVHKLDSKFISDIDYEKQVINKPFGVLSANTVVVNEDVSLILDTVATDTTPAIFVAQFSQVNSKALIPGANYTVTIDALSFTSVYESEYEGYYTISNDTTRFIKNGALCFIAIQSNDYTDGQTVSVSVVLAEDAIQKIDAKYIPSEAVPTSVDLSAYESSGTIVETYADGTTKTTSIEFDADGNPIKITDGDGNVTELTW